MQLAQLSVESAWPTTYLSQFAEVDASYYFG